MRILKRWANSKKAQDITTTLFYLLFGLVLAGFFIVAVMMRVKDAVNDSTYHKRFYARDLALLVDSMHAANGALMIKYEMITPEEMDLEAFLEPGRAFITDVSDKPVDQRAQTAFLFGSNSYTGVKNASITSNYGIFGITISNDRNVSFINPALGQGGPFAVQTDIKGVGGGGAGGGGGSAE